MQLFFAGKNTISLVNFGCTLSKMLFDLSACAVFILMHSEGN
jgi:hypothetical protein